MREPKYLKVYKVIPLIVLIFFWEVLVRGNSELIFFFGLPSKMAGYLYSKTMNGSLPIDFSVTFIEALAGFIIGNVVGALFGLSLWYSRTAFSISKPYIVALGSAPIFAFAPILMFYNSSC